MFAFDFDPSLPAVATSEFSTGEGIVRAGEIFDWRARGMTELDVVPMLRAGLLRQDRDAGLDELVRLSEEYGGYDDAPAPESIESRAVMLTVKPGETVRVETPSQRDQRRNKRR